MSQSPADRGPSSRGGRSSGLRLCLDVGTADGVTLPMPEAWLAHVAEAALASAGASGDVEIALLFGDDQLLQELNRQYRGVDRPTDVLSFPQEEPSSGAFRAPPDSVRHLGDVAISVPRAHRQAVAYGHSFERELGYLLTHGVLHLVGFDHEADADQAEMRGVEEQALATMGLGRAAEPGLGASA